MGTTVLAFDLQNTVGMSFRWPVRPGRSWGHVVTDCRICFAAPTKNFCETRNKMRAALLQLLGAALLISAGATFHHLPSSPWLRQRAPMIRELNRRLERVRSQIQRSGARGWGRLTNFPKNFLRGRLPMQYSGSKAVRNFSQQLMRLWRSTSADHHLKRLQAKIRDSTVTGLSRLQLVSGLPKQGLRGNLPFQGGGTQGLRNLSQNLQRFQLPQLPKPPTFQLARPHSLGSSQTSRLRNIFSRMHPASVLQRLQKGASQRLKRLTIFPPYLNQYNHLRTK